MVGVCRSSSNNGDLRWEIVRAIVYAHKVYLSCVCRPICDAQRCIWWRRGQKLIPSVCVMCVSLLTLVRGIQTSQRYINNVRVMTTESTTKSHSCKIFIHCGGWVRGTHAGENRWIDVHVIAWVSRHRAVQCWYCVLLLFHSTFRQCDWMWSYSSGAHAYIHCLTQRRKDLGQASGALLPLKESPYILRILTLTVDRKWVLIPRTNHTAIVFILSAFWHIHSVWWQAIIFKFVHVRTEIFTIYSICASAVRTHTQRVKFATVHCNRIAPLLLLAICLGFSTVP